MTARILLVDDEVNVLQSYQRSLRREFSRLELATGGAQALEMMAKGDPFAVIVSDMRMPSMDGVVFLAKAREAAPRTVRMMLTGNSDLDTAIRAVREGHIFRFLTKPCSSEMLAEALRAGVEQYRLVMAEVELLEKTLSGSVRLLTDLLSLLDPESFGRTDAARATVRSIWRALGQPPSWELDLATILAPIGNVTLPPVLLAKVRSGKALSPEESILVDQVPEVGARLVGNIPRLEGVAQIILHSRFQPETAPHVQEPDRSVPLGARVLRLVHDLLRLEEQGLPRASALARLTMHRSRYEPHVLTAALSALRTAPPSAAGGAASSAPGFLQIPVQLLRAGHVLGSHLMSPDGRLLLSAGVRLTEAHMERVRSFLALGGVCESVQIVPPSEAEGQAGREARGGSGQHG